MGPDGWSAISAVISAVFAGVSLIGLVFARRQVVLAREQVDEARRQADEAKRVADIEEERARRERAPVIQAWVTLDGSVGHDWDPPILWMHYLVQSAEQPVGPVMIDLLDSSDVGLDVRETPTGWSLLPWVELDGPFRVGQHTRHKLYVSPAASKLPSQVRIVMSYPANHQQWPPGSQSVRLPDCSDEELRHLPTH